MTVAQAAPADESAARLQDLVGNAAASFSGQDVTINTTPLTTSVSAVPNSHVGSSTFTFELRLTSAGWGSQSWKLLPDTR